MQVGETLLVLAMVGACCRAAKLLKTPRIYNAFVTSDEKLLPSQAYPAIAPVVHGIQYPLPSYIPAPSLYHPFIPAVPTFHSATTSGGRSFSYAVKQDYFSYNYFENDAAAAAFGPKVPVIAEPGQPAILMPVGLQPLPKEALAAYPASNSQADSRPEYHPEEQQPAEVRGDERNRGDDYGVPAAAADRKGHAQRRPAGRGHSYRKPAQADAQPQGYDSTNSAEVADEEPGTEGEADGGDNYLPVSSLVKNHRPKDPSIVDVPPEPLPIGESKGKKKRPEEYPPAPLGFAL